ncbi:hypothetical protein BpHYR1_026782, partial [Brachionus plicatilis]
NLFFLFSLTVKPRYNELLGRKIRIIIFFGLKKCLSSFNLSIASFELITCLFASCCSSISVSLSCFTGLFVAIESTISASLSALNQSYDLRQNFCQYLLHLDRLADLSDKSIPTNPDPTIFYLTIN